MNQKVNIMASTGCDSTFKLDPVSISTWIKCSERLPEVEDHYLIKTKQNQFYVAYFCKKGFGKKRFSIWKINCECCEVEYTNFYQEDVTDWMPLPETPN